MKLIVFDFDGTLADTRELIEASMDYTLSHFGLPIHWRNDWLKCVGLPVEEGLRRVFGSSGLPLSEILAVFRSFPWEANEYCLRSFPGADELLAYLREKGLKMALATSKRLSTLERQLNHLGWLGKFNPIVTPDVIEKGKPDPESLFRCLNTHNLEASEALMVGDAPFDLEMAQRAGVKSIGLSHGFNREEDLEPYLPEMILPDLYALKAWITKRLEP